MDDSPLCREVLTVVEVGKCATCELTERNLARDFEAHEEAVHDYDVRSVPTIVVDGRIKVEGRPEFPWMCGDEFYKFLERRYPLTPRQWGIARSTAAPTLPDTRTHTHGKAMPREGQS